MAWIVLGIVLTLIITVGVGLWLEDIFAAIVAGFIGFFATMIVCYPVGYAFHDERTISCHVTDKDRGGDSGAYRVYTEDCGVLANQDQWLHGKTDSADVWNQIKPGQTQRFHVVGWRFELLSDFPNILEVVK